ncbi:sugar ABC transporter permease [Thermus scotoductus]|uniref:Sugar ABC transporter permease n=1 Tax=Thermus scotoductus TaxID=37636 RepID=A0A430RFG9_THESC|nr:sugar ABC transporter permease [Thermus scotoductus]RTH06494.1 sugar ABC transporter permease [Thermus scotoductus]
MGRPSRDLSERTLALGLLLPAFGLLGLVAVYPVARLVWDSLHELHLAYGTQGSFAGLENYRRLLGDDRFLNTLRVTGMITLITVPGAALLGLGLALLANLPFTVKWPVRLGLLLPWAMPLVFAGLIFRWFFESDYGIVNDLLRRLGVPPLYWLTNPNLALWAICATIVWKTSSFVALVLLAGLQTIPREYYEAAQVDGAGPWQVFARITLPLLLPSFLVALIFRTITALQTFDIPFAMTGGGPGTATETLAMYIRTQSVENLNFGYGSAMAVALFLLCMSVTLLYLRYLERGERE